MQVFRVFCNEIQWNRLDREADEKIVQRPTDGKCSFAVLQSLQENMQEMGRGKLMTL